MEKILKIKTVKVIIIDEQDVEHQFAMSKQDIEKGSQSMMYQSISNYIGFNTLAQINKITCAQLTNPLIELYKQNKFTFEELKGAWYSTYRTCLNISKRTENGLLLEEEIYFPDQDSANKAKNELQYYYTISQR